jgi:hypothetical protein
LSLNLLHVLKSCPFAYFLCSCPHS